MAASIGILKRFAVVLAILSALTSPAAWAASSYFLWFDGIKGDAVEEARQDWIAIDSFSWGVHVIGGSSHTTGQTVFDDLGWTQRIDGSTPLLFDKLAKGMIIDQAILELTAPIGGAAPKPYFRMSFDNVMLTSMNISGTAPDAPTLHGAFAYHAITLDYWVFDPSGKVARHESASATVSGGEGGEGVGALAMLYARGMAGPEFVASVPEPETWALLLAGLGLVGGIARRRARPGHA